MLAEHLNTDKVAILRCVKNWGERLQEVDKVSRILNDRSVLLYAAIKQLGPLQHFLYGPLLPIAMIENSENAHALECQRLLKSLNLRPRVAVNPAIGKELLQMVKAALHDYINPDLFIEVDSIPIELSQQSNAAFELFASVHSLPNQSFIYDAARRLFSQEQR